MFVKIQKKFPDGSSGVMRYRRLVYDATYVDYARHPASGDIGNVLKERGIGFYLIPFGSPTEDEDYLYISISKKDGVHQGLVVSNCDMFIMNDQGKTIDSVSLK